MIIPRNHQYFLSTATEIKARNQLNLFAVYFRLSVDRDMCTDMHVGFRSNGEPVCIAI